MELQPHQQRVVAERDELGERLGKLHAFICSPKFRTVDEDERGRLRAQAIHMDRYLEVLDARIDNFPTA